MLWNYLKIALRTLRRNTTYAVLTARAARTHFGDADPVGQSLAVRIEDEVIEVTVAGVVETPPTRSSLRFDVLLPFDLYAYNYSGMIRNVILEPWDVSIVTTFALLRRADQRAALDEKLDAFAAERFGAPEAEEGVEVFGPDSDASNIELALQPLTAIHLNPEHPIGVLGAADGPYLFVRAGRRGAARAAHRRDPLYDADARTLGPPDEGGGHPQGAGRVGCVHPAVVLYRLSEADGCCVCGSNARSLLGRPAVAAGGCVSHRPGPVLFLVAGSLVAAVALTTVGVQAIQAARLNPVQNLRDE